ncbi:hypothetical protein [Candidatus Poriferisodalis sp.]|uniref:hypothetical protein n=1 Tax=Candidatus Poriferisodalis sp. TaxID=3101277 RepID=UPI003D0F0BCE
MFEMLGISKRTAAALAAMVVLLPLLVFVDPSPSAAHEQTTQRCDYDPISGQSYNCRNVPVSHVHPPNHYSPPPDTSPSTTAAPPPTTAAPPPTTAAPPPTTAAPLPNHYSPPPDTSPRPTTPPPNHYSPPPDTSPRPTTPPPNHYSPPPDTSPRPTTPPTTTVPPTTQPPQCHWPNHSHGSTCHAHNLTPPCGVGTWAPHSGHSPVTSPPCPTTPPNGGEDGDGGECAPTSYRPGGSGPTVRDAEAHRHAMGTQRNRNGATMSACHPVAQSHCNEDWHEHVHGSQNCHQTYRRLSSSLSDQWHHCTNGQHEHEHNSGQCHHKDEVHCEDGQHIHELTGRNGNQVDGDLHRSCHDFGDHPWIHEECGEGNHNHRGRMFPEIRGCHNEDTQHNSGELTRTDELLFWGTGEAVCFPAGGAVVKAAKIVAKGASWLKKILASQSAQGTIEIGANIGCGALWDRLVIEEARQHEANKKEDHNDLDDSDTGDANSEPEPATTQALPRPPTTERPPAPTTMTTEVPPAYCSAFESFGRYTSGGEPIGEVVLHREDGSTVSYQGSRSWVEATCQQALGQ